MHLSEFSLESIQLLLCFKREKWIYFGVQKYIYFKNTFLSENHIFSRHNLDHNICKSIYMWLQYNMNKERLHTYIE